MTLQIATLVDYPEEGWTSMDLCAELLIRNLAEQGRLEPVRICPTFRRRVQALPINRGGAATFNADRLVNRFWDYPQAARSLRDNFDFFHVCDHSYSQLVHELPHGRTGVYCHDLDAFRCLLDPPAEPRPRWFRWMMRRVLAGLTRAALIFCSTETLRRRILDAGLTDPGRVVVAPYGVAEEFRPELGLADASLPLPFDPGVRFLLHVGSTIPRKRIDVLLDTFARVRSRFPEIRLVQVGGTWTKEQNDRIASLGIGSGLIQLRDLSRSTLAALYRHAAIVLLPSEAEGFGLPLIEALACGAIIIVSDLAILREVGGSAAIYAPVGEPAAWAARVADLLEDRSDPGPRDAGLARAARYSWANQAQVIAEAYLGLLD
jgi:glycosyltransferase involved in cell wall biosynthesis